MNSRQFLVIAAAFAIGCSGAPKQADPTQPVEPSQSAGPDDIVLSVPGMH